MADEGDFLSLLIASERVANWLDAIRAHKSGGSLTRLKHAVKELTAALESEAYAEEARRAGAVPLLTSLLKRTDDEELLNDCSDALAACSGLMATSGKAHLLPCYLYVNSLLLSAVMKGHWGGGVRTFSYGGMSVVLKEGALGDGVGAKVWTVAHTFCREMAANPGMVSGAEVLEIGAGCGACGILAAKLGAASVALTDYVDAVLRNLHDCVHLNAGSAGSTSSGGDACSGEQLAAGCSDAANGAVTAAEAEAAAGAAAEGEEAWDPEDASECGSDDLGALLAEAAGAGGSGPQQRGAAPAPASWDAGPMRVRFYDWQESVEALSREERAALAAAPGVPPSARAAAGAQPGGSIDTGSNESGVPGLGGDERFGVVIGTDILYEWPMVQMVPAVVKHRLRPGGRALLCCAVREQAMFDAAVAGLRALGMRVGVTAVQPQADDAGLLDIRQDYEGGYVLLAVEHGHAPAADWHRDDLFC